jgi:hypothetical protein
MHLRGAGVGKADVDATRDQRPHQTFRTVHGPAPVLDCSKAGPDQSFFVHFVKGLAAQCSHRLRGVAFFNRGV